MANDNKKSNTATLNKQLKILQKACDVHRINKEATKIAACERGIKKLQEKIMAVKSSSDTKVGGGIKTFNIDLKQSPPFFGFKLSGRIACKYGQGALLEKKITNSLSAKGAQIIVSTQKKLTARLAQFTFDVKKISGMEKYFPSWLNVKVNVDGPALSKEVRGSFSADLIKVVLVVSGDIPPEVFKGDLGDEALQITFSFQGRLEKGIKISKEDLLLLQKIAQKGELLVKYGKELAKQGQVIKQFREKSKLVETLRKMSYTEALKKYGDVLKAAGVDKADKYFKYINNLKKELKVLKAAKDSVNALKGTIAKISSEIAEASSKLSGPVAKAIGKMMEKTILKEFLMVCGAILKFLAGVVGVVLTIKELYDIGKVIYLIFSDKVEVQFKLFGGGLTEEVPKNAGKTPGAKGEKSKHEIQEANDKNKAKKGIQLTQPAREILEAKLGLPTAKITQEQADIINGILKADINATDFKIYKDAFNLTPTDVNVLILSLRDLNNKLIQLGTTAKKLLSDDLGITLDTLSDAQIKELNQVLAKLTDGDVDMIKESAVKDNKRSFDDIMNAFKRFIHMKSNTKVPSMDEMMNGKNNGTSSSSVSKTGKDVKTDKKIKIEYIPIDLKLESKVGGIVNFKVNIHLDNKVIHVVPQGKIKGKISNREEADARVTFSFKFDSNYETDKVVPQYGQKVVIKSKNEMLKIFLNK